MPPQITSTSSYCRKKTPKRLRLARSESREKAPSLGDVASRASRASRSHPGLEHPAPPLQSNR